MASEDISNLLFNNCITQQLQAPCASVWELHNKHSPDKQAKPRCKILQGKRCRVRSLARSSAVFANIQQCHITKHEQEPIFTATTTWHCCNKQAELSDLSAHQEARCFCLLLPGPFIHTPVNKKRFLMSVRLETAQHLNEDVPFSSTFHIWAVSRKVQTNLILTIAHNANLLAVIL